MHPLTSDLAEQILALVRIEAYSLLGAIQDGKTVLGGSAGSDGGMGDPPAGFVGQLTQSNVTFDTDGATRACSAGSAGSASLIGNLDAIRLGTEICNDAIGDRHIDWGIGAGQVSALDVPFATTSGSIDATNVRDAIEETYAEGGGAGGAHTLLSGTHPDTDPEAVQQGDLLTGGSTLLWRRLARGTAHQIPKMSSGGTDVDWASFDWDEISAGSLADMVHDHGSAAEGGATLQLDWDTVWAPNAAVHDHSNDGEGGQSLLSLIDIRCNAATEETIDAFGNMNPDQIYVRVDTSLDAATDNLDTIVGGTEGDLLIMRPENDARTIVVRHNVGNIWLIGKTDVSLDDVNDHIMLIFDGSKWCDTGVGVLDHGALTGLGDPDHPQYLRADGTRALTGAWDVGAHLVTFGTGITFSGGSAVNVITVPDDNQQAFNLVDSGGSPLEYMRIDSRDAQPIVDFNNAGEDIDIYLRSVGVNGLFVQGSDGALTVGGPSMTVPDGWIVGIGPALERIVFDAAGDISVMGANFGVGTLEPLQNVAGGAADFGGLGLHIKSASWAQLVIEGSSGAFLNMIDLGGAADDKVLTFIVDAGIARFFSRNDDLTIRTDNILVMDMGSGNVGIGTTGPQEKLAVAGNLALPKTSGNGIKVDNTTPTFGWRDLRAEIRTRGGGASDPSDATYQGNIKAFSFLVNDEAWIEFHIPHDYVAGTDIHLHFHWSHNSAIVTGGNVTWEADVTYAKGHNQAAFPATVNPTLSPNASTTQYQHMVSEVQLSATSPGGTQIDTDDLEPDGLVIARVYLSANNITSSGAVPDPFLHEVDIHYQSTNIATKQKAPDFYT